MFRTMCCAVLLLATTVISGCGHTGQFNAVNSTDVTLTSNNYRVIESGLSATDVGFKVFGIGDHASYAKAMSKLRILAELDGRPRALINITEDVDWWNLGLVSGDAIGLSCDVVEFTGPPNGK